jgi:pimeloyl-ACP methyl ester carboxylesterase
LIRLTRWLGLYWHQPLVQGALRRRQTWPSRQACYEHYRARPLFASWPEASLRAYVEAATRPRANGGFELIYPPQWEARIFATTPTDIWRDVPQLRVPALFVRGERSDVFRPECQRRIARCLPGARFAVVPDAGHLAPLERPAQTGAVIRDFLE